MEIQTGDEGVFMIPTPLTYTGRAKYPFTAESDWDNAIFPDAPEPREATGWEYNTETALYNADGTPKTVAKTVLEEEGDGPLLWIGDSKWIAFKSTAEAKRALKVPVA